MKPLRHSAGITPSRASGAGRAVRRGGGLAAALLGATAVCGSPALAAAPTVAVEGDSVLVTGGSFGATTVRATRPDAVTGKPVVIGQFEGSASGITPLSVNTTVPTAFAPNGDCWQKGALPSALTPDLRPGDRVTVTQSAFGGQPSTTSVVVTAEMVKRATGPIPGCKDIAPFARNAVTSLPGGVAAGPLALSGVAQPFAKGVSVSASDGKVSTAPVAVSAAADGRWAATIPAGELARLGSGQVTVTPVFDVPDVSTGAMAHIAGVPAGLSKSPAAGAPGHGSRGSSPNANRPHAKRVRSLHRPARIRIRTARRKGIRASFVVPSGAKIVRVQLKRARRTVMQRVVPAGTAGSRQRVRLHGPRLRRVLHPGTYRLVVSAGPSLAALGRPAAGAIVVVR
jgi:hypothetical protein